MGREKLIDYCDSLSSLFNSHSSQLLPFLSVFIYIYIFSAATASKLFLVILDLYSSPCTNLADREVIASTMEKVAVLIKCWVKAFVYFNGFSSSDQEVVLIDVTFKWQV